MTKTREVKSRSRNHKKMSRFGTHESKLSFSNQSTRLNTNTETYASRPRLSLTPSIDRINKNQLDEPGKYKETSRFGEESSNF